MILTLDYVILTFQGREALLSQHLLDFELFVSKTLKYSSTIFVLENITREIVTLPRQCIVKQDLHLFLAQLH